MSKASIACVRLTFGVGQVVLLEHPKIVIIEPCVRFSGQRSETTACSVWPLPGIVA